MTPVRRSVASRWLLPCACLALLLAAGWPASSSAQEASGGSLHVEGTGEDVRVAGADLEVVGDARSIWVAGATVAVAAEADDSLWAAGASVSVDSIVGKNMRVAGSRVTVRGIAGGRVWIAGGDVAAELTTGSNLYAAGGNVAIGPRSDIGGDVAAAGGRLSLAGRVRGNANLAGGLVTIDGVIDGTVRVAAERLVLAPGARLGQDLVLAAATVVDVRPGAEIAGERRAPRVDFLVDEAPGHLGSRAFVVAGFLFGAAFLVGVGLLVLAKSAYVDAVGRFRGMVVTSFLIGLAAIALIPVCAGVVGLTVIGLPLAFALLLLLPIVLVCGYGVAALGIADWLMNRRDHALGAARALLFLVIGALLVALVALIPYVGPAVVTLAAIAGTGAFLRVLGRRLRRSVAVVPT